MAAFASAHCLTGTRKKERNGRARTQNERQDGAACRRGSGKKEKSDDWVLITSDCAKKDNIGGENGKGW